MLCCTAPSQNMHDNRLKLNTRIHSHKSCILATYHYSIHKLSYKIKLPYNVDAKYAAQFNKTKIKNYVKSKHHTLQKSS